MALAKPVGTGRKEEISLDSAAGHVLEECRMVLPGIQALFGFQLIAVFNLSMALVMTPAALHRMAEPKKVSERFLWLASNMILAGMFPLALAVGLDAYVVASVVLHNDVLAALIATLLMLVFAALWLLLPRREVRRHG